MFFTFAGANGEIVISVVCMTLDRPGRAQRAIFSRISVLFLGASKPEIFLNVEQLIPTLSLLLFKNLIVVLLLLFNSNNRKSP